MIGSHETSSTVKGDIVAGTPLLADEKQQRVIKRPSMSCQTILPVRGYARSLKAGICRKLLSVLRG